MEVEGTIIWNVILTLIIMPFAWAFNKMFTEVKRLQILLNKTREEYLPRDDAQSQTSQILEQLRRLEEKLDRFIEKQNG